MRGELNNESGGTKGSKAVRCTIADDRERSPT